MQNDLSDPKPETLLTVRDVAARLNCGVATVWRNVQRGNLPKPVRIGGLTRWRPSDIAAVLAKAA